jgi:hypothetical protein
MSGRLLGRPTMVSTTSNWEDELQSWLKPFLDHLAHKARRRMCPPLCGRTDRAWRIPPTSPPHKSEAGKKSTGRRLNRRYRPSATPSSASSFEQLLSNVRTVECGSARKSSVGKSAKVVLGRAVKRPSSRGRRRQRIKLKRPGIVCRGRQAALETGKAPRVRNRDR